MNVIDRVTTGRCNLEFFRGGSKVKVNIVMLCVDLTFRNDVEISVELEKL